MAGNCRNSGFPYDDTFSRRIEAPLFSLVFYCGVYRNRNIESDPDFIFLFDIYAAGSDDETSIPERPAETQGSVKDELEWIQNKNGFKEVFQAILIHELHELTRIKARIRIASTNYTN